MKPLDDRVMPSFETEHRFGEKLQPCPFCGSASVGLFVSIAPHVTCTKCGADGPAVEGSRESLEERQHRAVRLQHRAVRLWNMRI